MTYHPPLGLMGFDNPTGFHIVKSYCHHNMNMDNNHNPLAKLLELYSFALMIKMIHDH